MRSRGTFLPRSTFFEEGDYVLVLFRSAEGDEEKGVVWSGHVSDVFELGGIEHFFEDAGDARGFVFELVKLSFGGAELIGKVQAGEHGDAGGAPRCRRGRRL